jgi:hypothetical protein
VSIFVPDLIYAGDTLVFDVPDFKDAIGDSISSGTYTLTWYARFNDTLMRAVNCCWDGPKRWLAGHC